jgi:hypothetical protein
LSTGPAGHGEERIEIRGQIIELLQAERGALAFHGISFEARTRFIEPEV